MKRLGLPLIAFLFLGVPVRADDKVDYFKQIKPILAQHCYSCHGGLKQRGGLRLDTGELLRRGGDNGPAALAGKAEESHIVERISAVDLAFRMPPDGEALSAKDIGLLKNWIAQGATSPADEKPEANPRDHWAFRKPVRPALPAVKNQAWVRNPIDQFILAEQEKRGLAPVAPAPRATLLRRVYLDLIGLPPTREELHSFLNDESPDAYEKVVERLLASPQYGERWARHWMDVWRYSDWYGRRGVPDVWNSAPQIWRWRDWIVRSLNDDKGYDRMLMEMLAADEIAPEDDEASVATGYLVRNWYALNPNQWMRDIVEHTGKAFLGLTFNCAHCHDHKYDPISQEEYFRFRAFFEPLQLRQDRVPGEPDPGPFQKYDYSVLRKVAQYGSIRVFDEQLDAKTLIYLQGDERNLAKDKKPAKPGGPTFLNGNKLAIEPLDLPAIAYYPGLKTFVLDEEQGKRAKAIVAARADLEKARQTFALALRQLEAGYVQGKDENPIDPRVVDARTKAMNALHAAAATTSLSEARLLSAEAEKRAFQTRLAAERVRFGQASGDLSAVSRTAGKAERLATVRTAFVRILEGETSLTAAKVRLESAAAGKDKTQAQTGLTKAEQELAAAKKAYEAASKAQDSDASQYTPLSPIYPVKSTGRRRALAQWLASSDNPLTARVAVNHIWMRHFERPLVESVADFGRNGKKPTHPQLLDWLAMELMEMRNAEFGTRNKGEEANTARSTTNDRSPSIPHSELRIPHSPGWSMKHLHRLIVTSNTYRVQSAAGKGDRNLTVDQDNRWLWRFPTKRVEAEVVRDSVLHLAGELDRTLGGKVLETVDEATSHRRSLYFSVYPEGGGSLQFLDLFDPPDTCDCYRRSVSIVPQQALGLTNSRLLIEQSRLLARRLPGESDTEFIIAAFEQVLTRQPTEQEKTACQEFLTRQVKLYGQSKTATGKGEATVAPAADPRLRARESLVRALFNHEEFVTMR